LTKLPATYQIDHVVPLQHGGDNSFTNLQALCPDCHATKTLTEAIDQKLAPPTTTPHPTPQLHPLQHACQQCNKAFSSKYNLQRHATTCKGVGAKQCPTCKKVFSSAQGKYQHIKNVKCQPPIASPTTNVDPPPAIEQMLLFQEFMKWRADQSNSQQVSLSLHTISFFWELHPNLSLT
jgi:hypothetical protein